MKEYKEATAAGEGFVSGYPEGNLEKWGFSITAYLPQAWTVLMKTIDPLIYATLIELLGNNNLFQKKTGQIIPVVTDGIVSAWAISLVYNVPDFVGSNKNPAAVKHDQDFVLSKIKALNVQWPQNPIKIDTVTGELMIQFTLPIGY